MIQEGLTRNEACSDAGVVVHFGTEWDPAGHREEVATVEVAGFLDACAGERVDVVLTHGEDVVGRARGPVLPEETPEAPLTTGPVPLGAPRPAASDVERAHVIVYSPAPEG